MPKRPVAIKPKSGQESVWDYPRPPRIERTQRQIQVYFADQLIATTTGAYRVLETSHPPVYYLPPNDVRMAHLEAIVADATSCEWKGQASYFNVFANGQKSTNAAWSYKNPVDRFLPIKDFLAFYPAKMQRCTVGGLSVTAQPGEFYGGWITPDVAGPFKGGPGSFGW